MGINVMGINVMGINVMGINVMFLPAPLLRENWFSNKI